MYTDAMTKLALTFQAQFRPYYLAYSTPTVISVENVFRYHILKVMHGADYS